MLSSDEPGDGAQLSAYGRFKQSFSRRKQYYLDLSTPHVKLRWVFAFFLLCLYVLRVFLVGGFYIVTYSMSIYLLNLFIAFLSPQIDPEVEGPLLPTKKDEEYRPFVRRLPEFRFWYATAKVLCISIICTFFRVLDLPVFWPILVIYFGALFILTMKRQIRHMIKYRYVPFSWGKTVYKGKQGAAPPGGKKNDK
mmetsp:Transcript_21776/g.36018  ORF Transcript_21776/g.36018 Transcript_21776/m.36018 type:complete len:194 (+) Transcript_21776:76-657(+)